MKYRYLLKPYHPVKLCKNLIIMVHNVVSCIIYMARIKADTQSSEDSESVPSTPKQLVFAKYLKEELEHEGFADVEMDDKGYIYATLKGNTKKPVPTIGFISHYDTSPDCSGKDIKPRIVKAYDGGDIVLSEGIVSSPAKFPELLAHRGEDLIVTDGHTLLGADDKAGIAEIVQAMCYLRDHDTPLLIYQGRLNLIDRAPQQEGILDYCRQQGVGFISFSPLAQGLLTDRYLNGIPADSRMAQHSSLSETALTPELLTKLHDWHDEAEAQGKTLPAYALDWILDQEGVTSVLVGASSTQQLAQNIRA